MDVTAAAGRWRSNPKWLRAAALGSLWATSEIVLGSFLHNLKVPFRGHALTAIAVLLLSGAQRRWGGRGVVWRAGLVAAVMKSASPSAVLLGPMLAISMEGFAFEAGLAIGRGGLIGCLIGGVLAMSWTFLHLLLSLLLSYGTNLVEVYRQLVGSAAQQLGPMPFGAVGPIAALALVNMAVGVAAAFTGWRAGGHRAAAGAWRTAARRFRCARPVRRARSRLPCPYSCSWSPLCRLASPSSAARPCRSPPPAWPCSSPPPRCATAPHCAGCCARGSGSAC